MPTKFSHVLVTCEHASRHIPADWWALFKGKASLVNSHRGWDKGAAWLAQRIAEGLGAPLYEGRATRLLVDLNRSEGHRSLFSEITRGLSGALRQSILERYYYPFRIAARNWVEAACGGGKVLHISAHTFTPVLNGVRRELEIGLLYDPSRACERAFCVRWRERMEQAMGGVRVRMNQPYRGVSDGHATALRREFGPSAYAGVELEVNQALLEKPVRQRQVLAERITATLSQVLDEDFG